MLTELTEVDELQSSGPQVGVANHLALRLIETTLKNYLDISTTLIYPPLRKP